MATIDVTNIAALRALNPSSGQTAYVQGYYGVGDGGEGEFTWVGTSSEADNAGTVIQSNVISSGRWIRNERSDKISVRWFGARADLNVDDTGAFQRAIGTGRPVYVPAGSYRLDGQITILQSNTGFYGPDVRGSAQLSCRSVNGPQFLCGGTLSQSRNFNITFQHLTFDGPTSAPLFHQRNLRGLHVLNCTGSNFYQFALLGDNNNVPTDPNQRRATGAYVTSIYDCELSAAAAYIEVDSLQANFAANAEIRGLMSNASATISDVTSYVDINQVTHYRIVLVNTSPTYFQVNETVSVNGGNSARVVSAYRPNHFFEVQNFSGQFDYQNTYVEGGFVGGVNGFNCTSNAQDTIDHFVMKGTYFSRFWRNINIVNERIGNISFESLISEGAADWCVNMEVDPTINNATFTGGWGPIFSDLSLHSSKGGIRFLWNNASSWQTNGGITLNNIHANVGAEAIHIETIASANPGDLILQNISINGLLYSPEALRGVSDGTTDAIFIKTANSNIANVNIDNVSAYAAARVRDVIRIEGDVGNVTIGESVNGNYAGRLINQINNSTATALNLTSADVANNDTIRVYDESRRLHSYVPTGQLPLFLDNARFTAFRLDIRNNNGVIEHRIGAANDSAGDRASPPLYVLPLSGVTSTWSTTPNGMDNTTPFNNGLKIGNTSNGGAFADFRYLVLNANVAQGNDSMIGVCSIIFNTTGRNLYPLSTRYVSSQIPHPEPSQFRTWPGILFYDDSGSIVLLNTTNIPNGTRIALQFIGFLR